MRALLLLLLCACAALADAEDLLAEMRADDWNRRFQAFERITRRPPAERIELMRAVLGFGDRAFRAQVAIEMGKLAPRHGAALDLLAAALFDENAHVRGQAAQALERFGPAAWRIAAALDDADAWIDRVREKVGRPDASAAFPAPAWVARGRALDGSEDVTALDGALVDPHPYVRRAAARALARAPGGVDVLVRRLSDRDARIRRRVALALKRSERPDALAGALRDPDPEVQRAAVNGLVATGRRLDALVAFLADAPPDAVRDAMPYLAEHAPEPTRDYLRTALGHADAARRWTALQLAESIGAEARPLVDAIAQARFDEDAGVRRWAEQVLRKLDPAALQPPPDPFGDDATDDELRAALLGDDWRRAGHAARRLGPGHEPALGRALRHPSSFVRGEAAATLVRHNAVATLAGGLRDPDPRVRQRAALALRDLGSAAAPAVPVLLELLADDLYAAGAAMQALGAIGPPASAAKPLVRKILAGPDETRARIALDALAKIGAEDDVDAIARLLDHPSLGSYAVGVLGGLGELAAPHAPAIARIVLDRPRDPQFHAITALVRIGAAGHRALEPVMKLEHHNVKRAVVMTLLHHKARTPAARALLERAAKDPDRRVAARARHALEQLR